MTLIKDRAIIDDEYRRQVRQINCLHVKRIRLTMHCLDCGKINTVTVKSDEICPSVVDCLCISKKNLAY